MANTPLKENGAGGLVCKALRGLRLLANTPLSTHIFYVTCGQWLRRVLSTPSTEFQYYHTVMFITTHLFDMCSSMPASLPSRPHTPMGMRPCIDQGHHPMGCDPIAEATEGRGLQRRRSSRAGGQRLVVENSGRTRYLHLATMNCILVGALISVKSRGGILRCCFPVVCGQGGGGGGGGGAGGVPG